MKILIVEPDQSIQSVVESVLKKKNPDYEIALFSEIQSAKSVLGEGNIDFIALSLTAENITENAKILKSISKALHLTKALILLPEAILAEHPDFDLLKGYFKTVEYVLKPLSVIKLSSTIMDIFTDFTQSEPVEILYLPVKLDLLKNLATVPCDVFVKISEKKYIKVIHKDQQDAVLDTATRYQTKGIEVLYVEKTAYPKISQLIMNDILSASTEKIAPAEKGIKITESIMMITSDLGVSPEIIDSINNSYTDVIKNLENEKVGNLLASLSTNENMFIANHGYLTSVFSVMLSQKMEWSNSKVQSNLCMAALLHDIVLADHNLGAHEKDSLEDIKKLPKETRELVLNHPTIIADKLSKTTKLPSDVIALISKHHEGRGKDSYPRAEFATQLSPVNCLFNVAHQFSIELYKIGFNNMKLDLAFANLREYYKGSNMKTFIDLLEKHVVI